AGADRRRPGLTGDLRRAYAAGDGTVPALRRARRRCADRQPDRYPRGGRLVAAALGYGAPQERDGVARVPGTARPRAGSDLMPATPGAGRRRLSSVLRYVHTLRYLRPGQ